MFDNLGLKEMTNGKVDANNGYILDIIDRFLYREYEKDGTGGLFRTSNPDKDMREEEIWYQMMEYLKSNRE